jgi:hypothetical protein
VAWLPEWSPMFPRVPSWSYCLLFSGSPRTQMPHLSP